MLVTYLARRLKILKSFDDQDPGLGEHFISSSPFSPLKKKGGGWPLENGDIEGTKYWGTILAVWLLKSRVLQLRVLSYLSLLQDERGDPR